MYEAAELNRLTALVYDDALQSLLVVEHVPAWASSRLFHLREAHGRQEVDLVIEASDGRIVALEIKADASPPISSAKHLGWMRDRLGDRFAFGVVLHSGPLPYMIDERIAALPICSIWG